MMKPGTLLLVGSGEQLYREYLLASIAHEAPIWLLDAAKPTWQRRYLAGWTTLDALDAPSLIAASREVAGSHAVDGLVCYDEALIMPAAHVVDALGLPGMTLDSVRRCRDKLATRHTLARARVPQPQAREAASYAEARTAADAIGYPVVLKPRGLGASQGVVVVKRPDKLRDAWASTTEAFHPGVPTYDSILVEECVQGPEISVDGFVAEGRYEPLFLTRKQLGLEPYFEETGHLVDAADPLLTSPELLELLDTTHRALGIERGMTHAEIRLTSAGPKVIEVNGRLGGDLIPFLGLQATGVNPGGVAVAVATGRRPSVQPTRRRCVGIRFCYPPEDCRVTAVRLPTGESANGLIAAAVIGGPGAEVRLPPRGYAERVAHVICHGADPADCAGRLDVAAALVGLEWQALADEGNPVFHSR